MRGEEEGKEWDKDKDTNTESVRDVVRVRVWDSQVSCSDRGQEGERPGLKALASRPPVKAKGTQAVSLPANPLMKICGSGWLVIIAAAQTKNIFGATVNTISHIYTSCDNIYVLVTAVLWHAVKTLMLN